MLGGGEDCRLKSSWSPPATCCSGTRHKEMHPAKGMTPHCSRTHPFLPLFSMPLNTAPRPPSMGQDWERMSLFPHFTSFQTGFSSGAEEKW